jgi:hypothetical protein
MFKRLFWLSVGLSIGFGCSFWAMRAVRRAVERYAPEKVRRDLAQGARTLLVDLREAVAEGREAMRERERDLRAELERRPPARRGPGR